jgi:hypothetical protein
MLDLQKKGVTVPPNFINDLRNAKLMIIVSQAEGRQGEESQKVEDYLGSLESVLINEAQKALSPEIVDQWLRRLGEASSEIGEEKIVENRFIAGVPRDQKWVRVEPVGNLPTERILLIAKESNLLVNGQKDGRLLVYGQSESIKGFLKKMTLEATKKQ